MDTMMQTQLFRELRRIADALEANNKLIEQNNELFKQTMKGNDKKHQETMKLNGKALQTTQSWIDWNKQRVIEVEEQQRSAARLAMKSSNSDEDFENDDFDKLRALVEQRRLGEEKQE